MRTEMVIRMQGGGSDKGRGARAMKVAAAVAGVESVALAGKDRSLLRVVGDGVDCNDLTTRLRRKVGRADLVELRTLHGAAGYGYYGPRAGSGLSRADSGYGGSSSYGGYGGGYYPAATSYAPEYYYGHQQPASYGYYQPAPYAAAPTVVHHEYYPPSTDPNGCSIM